MRLLIIIIFGIQLNISNAQKIDTLSILFESNKYELTEIDKYKLDTFINDNTQFVILQGHTDNTNTISYNYTLSKQRAYSIYTYLQSKNINIFASVNYFSEMEPRNANTNELLRSKNRRVAVIKFNSDKNSKEITPFDLNIFFGNETHPLKTYEFEKLILEYIKAIIWPLIILLLALIFNKPIRTLISKVKRLIFPGGIVAEITEPKAASENEIDANTSKNANAAFESSKRKDLTAEDFKDQYIQIKNAIIQSVEKSYSGTIYTDIRLYDYYFDIGVYGQNYYNVTAFEIKYFPNNLELLDIQETINKVKEVSVEYYKNVFGLVLIIVVDNLTKEISNEIHKLKNQKNLKSIPMDIQIYETKDVLDKKINTLIIKN